eukprot:TRINITY_DN1282_c0_g1_i1.p2 TRINITY_DN1282_c0_g1~~TRINITY_DN1282_c0_g1_i1.p2  ORF type:complete len:129 (-),score=41.17 TRINITY_DN1282_c0_g1_i1:146-532(-)
MVGVTKQLRTNTKACLEKLTLFYCDNEGSSVGARQFVEKVSKANIFQRFGEGKFEAIVRQGHHPLLVGKYGNGFSKEIGVKNQKPQKIEKHALALFNSRGFKNTKLRSRKYTKHPSIQGMWSPFKSYQ